MVNKDVYIYTARTRDTYVPQGRDGRLAALTGGPHEVRKYIRRMGLIQIERIKAIFYTNVIYGKADLY